MKGAKPRLLLIGNTLETFGGGERWLLEVATLLKNKYRITILNPISKKSLIKSRKEDILRSYNLKGIEVIDLPSLGINSKAFGTESFLLMVPGPKSLAIINERIKNADVVYCLSSNPVILGAVVHLSNLYRKRMIFGVHNPSFYKIFGKPESIKQAVMNRSYRALLKGVLHFHVLNAEDERLVRIHYPKARAYRIPNFLTRRPPKIVVNKERFVVLFVARFQKYQKGIDLLEKIVAEVIKRNKRIVFHLVGSGGDGEGIVRSLASRYKNNVKWLGFLDLKRLDREYADAGALAFPSRFEGFPLTVLEAQSHGLPVVAFDVKGSKEIITSGAQGSLIEPFDIDDFVRRIVELRRTWINKSGYLNRKRMISKIVYDRYSKRRILAKLNRMLSG